MTIPVIPGLGAIAADYDGYIIDVWGVLYDGGAAFPGAADCLKRLKAGGKRIVVLSNSPRRGRVVGDRLAEIGIDADHYDHVLTSGEEAHQHLLTRRDPWYAALGRRCFETGRGRFSTVLKGLDLESVDTLDAAEFVFNAGTEGELDQVADYADMLAAAARRGLPMVCANPDAVVIHGGQRMVCAGALAAAYERLGGQVRYHGKPHAPIYRTVFDLLGLSDLRRVLAIGDGLPTDIAGAAEVGIDSLLIAGGIHAEALGVAPGEAPAPDRVTRLCATAMLKPRAAAAVLAW
jgi:HAD superfamily hydrolase (TIGR01459 family)